MSKKNVSVFHAELLGYLLQTSKDQISDVGLDPEKDPKIKALLEGLAPEVTDRALPLSEIIENYQYLLRAEGPVHIEKALMEAFSAKEFAELGLYRYYPKIYRGLPRVYKNEAPTESHIKKEFTNLPCLKWQVLSKALFSLYANVKPQGKVTVFTWVIQDGFGDFIAAAEVVCLLRARFPDVDVQFVCLIGKNHQGKLTFPEKTTVCLYDDVCELNCVSKEAISILRKSDLILQIPTYYPHTDELIKKVRTRKFNPKVEHVGEYGYLESSWFHPKTNRYSLGLHFLEKGILIKKTLESSWSDVQNEFLQKHRDAKNHFYLAYLATSVGGAVYLHSLLKSLENDPLNIDLCVPNLGWFISFCEMREKQGESLLEWDLNVREIEVQCGDRLHILPISETGKRVRLLCPESLSPKDFRHLLALSGDWVGVRGDQSFSEAVSQGKAFFYDGREHSRYFMKDLLGLAENRLQAFPSTLECIRGMCQGFVYNLPVQESKWVDEVHFQELDEWPSIALKIGLSLQDDEVVGGFKELSHILKREHSAASFLLHLVQRGLCHKKNPEIEAIEKENTTQVFQNQKSFKELIEIMKKALWTSTQN